MFKPTSILAAASVAAFLGSSFAAGAADPPVAKSGDILIAESGMTPYVFDKDSEGKSACNGPCAGLRPPVVAAAGAKAVAPYSMGGSCGAHPTAAARTVAASASVRR